MKECMKNYLKKVQENEKKGFSLVELIIVMAIMAILVGVVASQVIPYMEKSRQSKDQQQLSAICTNMVAAIAQDPNFDQSTLQSALSFQLTVLKDNTTEVIEKTFCDLSGQNGANAATVEATFLGKMKSKAANNAMIFVTLNPNGTVTIEAGAVAGTPASEKLIAISE